MPVVNSQSISISSLKEESGWNGLQSLIITSELLWLGHDVTCSQLRVKAEGKCRIVPEKSEGKHFVAVMTGMFQEKSH